MIRTLAACALAFGAQFSSAATICLPEQAGGIGKDFYAVMYPSEGIVVYSYYCNGQPRSIIALSEFKPMWPLPAKGKPLATELMRLDAMQAHASPDKITTVHKRIAEQQLRLYQPSPAERKNMRSMA